MPSVEDRQTIVDWLQQRGHSPDEIDAIMEKLEQYDARVVRQSFFDAIETGEINIDSIFEESRDESGMT